MNRIVDLILDEGLRPGDRLPSERDLGKRLGVGRSSLREAIKMLGAVGIVEASVGEGILVGDGRSSILNKTISWGFFMDECSARQVIDARRALESKLAGFAAERASEEEIAAIDGCLEGMQSAECQGTAFTARDLEFHLAVARAGHNAVMYTILETLQRVTRVWMEEVRTGYFQGKPEPALGEHILICEAIRAGDATAAKMAMESHLANGGKRLLEVVASRGRRTK